MTRSIRVPLAGIDTQALDRAREDGIAAGRAAVAAESGDEAAQAYAQGRRDFVAIMRDDAAKGRRLAAITIAGDTSLSVTQAIEKLSAMPLDAPGAVVARPVARQQPGHDELVQGHLARLIPTTKH